jgi:hypothetical protein
VAIITVEIDLTDMDLVITAMTAIPEIHALFVRNHTADPRSIYQRNKRLKRLDLGLKTSIDLALRPETPMTSIHTSRVHTYNMWPKSKVKII